MATVRGSDTLPLHHPSPVFHHYAMDHTKSVQLSKSAVHSKVSKTSDSIGRTEKRKTYSHAEVQQKSLRKRGVYVEKKAGGPRASRGDMHASPLIQAYMAHTGRGNRRRSPVPRRHNTFITEVLSALSNKSAASTQYPPVSEVLPSTHLKPVCLKRNASVSTSDGVAQDVRKSEELVEKVASKHKKHRKRGHKRRRSPKSVLELKSQTNVAQTPSLVSQCETARKHGRRHGGKKGSDAKELQRSIYKEHESRIASAVLEGQEYRTARRDLVDDRPVTLVSAMDQPEDKGLYKLFMNLLETTFSVYNVDTNHRNADAIGTKYDQERYRNEPQSYSVTDDFAARQYHSKHWRKTAPVYANHWRKNAPIYANHWRKNALVYGNNWRKDAPVYANHWRNPAPVRAKPKPKAIVKKRAMRKSPSQYYYRSIKRQLESSIPVTKQKGKRTLAKTQKKETLLGLIKHELHVDANRPCAPKNLYQALLIIATNKLKQQRLTRFREDHHKEHSPDRNAGHRSNLKRSVKRPFLTQRSFVKLKEQLVSCDSEDEVVVPQIEDVSSYRTLEVLALNDKKGSDGRNLDSDGSASWDSAQ